MFNRVDVPVLGVVENMSEFVCPCCGDRVALFGSGGGERIAAEFGIPVLGRIPILPAIREGGDSGNPIALGDGEEAETFRSLAESVWAELEAQEGDAPEITIS